MRRAASPLRPAPRLYATFRRVLRAVTVVLLVQAGDSRAEDPKTPPPPPEQVTLAHKQYERLTSVFGLWQSSASASPSETAREAAIRKASRLLILPTPTPLLGTQRRFDGFDIVVSLGLVALLDELLLAESTVPSCFDAFAAEVTSVLDSNRKSAQAYADALTKTTESVPQAKGQGKSGGSPSHAQPASPVHAWPRCSDRIGKTGTAWGQVKPAVLQSVSTRAWVSGNTDSVALWLLTHQVAVLAQNQAIVTLAPKPAATASAPVVQEPLPQSPVPSQARSQCFKDATAAAAAASAASSLDRARLALCTNERNDNLRTLTWLQNRLPVLGR